MNVNRSVTVPTTAVVELAYDNAEGIVPESIDIESVTVADDGFELEIAFTGDARGGSQE